MLRKINIKKSTSSCTSVKLQNNEDKQSQRLERKHRSSTEEHKQTGSALRDSHSGNQKTLKRFKVLKERGKKICKYSTVCLAKFISRTKVIKKDIFK